MTQPQFFQQHDDSPEAGHSFRCMRKAAYDEDVYFLAPRAELLSDLHLEGAGPGRKRRIYFGFYRYKCRGALPA